MTDKKIENKLYTYQEVADIFQVHSSTISRYVRRKNNPLKVVYLNPESKKEPRVRHDDLLEFIKNLKQESKNK